MTRPSVARVLLSISLLLSYVITSVMVLPWPSLPRPWGLARWVPLEGLLHPVAWGALGVVYAACIIAFLARWREDAVGWAALALLGVLVTFEMSVRQIFMPQVESMLAGGLLSAWLVGRAVWRAEAPHERDRRAHEAVLGVFGAMLTLAAVSKLWLSGLAWFDGGAHCAVIFEHNLAAGGPMASLRGAVSQSFTLCSMGAAYTMVVELAGVLFVVPQARRPLAWAVVVLFFFLAFFQAIWEVNWALMALALTYSALGEPRVGGPDHSASTAQAPG